MNAPTGVLDLILAALIWLIDFNPLLDFAYFPVSWVLVLLGG